MAQQSLGRVSGWVGENEARVVVGYRGEHARGQFGVVCVLRLKRGSYGVRELREHGAAPVLDASPQDLGRAFGRHEDQVPSGRVIADGALPLLRRGDDVHAVGLSAAAPGAYAERLVVEESLMFALPNGLPPDLGALTEPMAIGWHAVQRAEIKKSDVAIVIGCGPVGLAVICMLKAQGVASIVASDFARGRRELATACGAIVVVDPNEESPYEAAGDRSYLKTVPALAELGIGTMEKLTRLPVPWHHVMRIADRLGAKPKHPVIFECVGVPGIIDGIIGSAPLFSRVVVVGVCMTPDKIRPAMAINKEIDLRFVVGYTPLEFRDTLHMLADGKVNYAPLVTGTVGLPGVERAFDALGSAESHAKILIDPRSATASV